MSKFSDKLKAPPTPKASNVAIREWVIPKVGVVHECVGCGCLVMGKSIRCQRCIADLHALDRCKVCSQLEAQQIPMRQAIARLIAAMVDHDQGLADHPAVVAAEGLLDAGPTLPEESSNG